MVMTINIDDVMVITDYLKDTSYHRQLTLPCQSQYATPTSSIAIVIVAAFPSPTTTRLTLPDVLLHMTIMLAAVTLSSLNPPLFIDGVCS